MDFSGGLWLLCWIVVVVVDVDVGPCTCISVYQVLLLSWRAQATLHQLSCDLGRGVYVPCGGRVLATYLVRVRLSGHRCQLLLLI